MVASLNHFDDIVDDVIAILNHYHMKKCDLNCQRAHKFGFLLDSAFLCGDTEIFWLFATHTAAWTAGKNEEKSCSRYLQPKILTHRCRLCFFFSLVHMSYDSSGANCASMNCAQCWVSTSIYETQQRNWVKKRDKHREPIAEYTRTQEERREEGERAMRYSHLQREHCCYNNFFVYFARRLVDFNEI